jgi:hypothetical protein
MTQAQGTYTKGEKETERDVLDKLPCGGRRRDTGTLSRRETLNLQHPAGCSSMSNKERHVVEVELEK